MAAPIENMRSSVRIRIKLDTDKKSIRTASRKYWILVQECPTLSTISDLQVQIIDRFHLENNSIKLCLEHFLLPSWESVRILRENDLLSVQNNDAIKHEAYGQLAPKLRVQMEEKQPNSQSCTDEQTTRKKKKKKRKRHHSDSDDNVMDFQEEEVIQPDVIQTVAEQLEQCLVDAEFKQEDPHAEGPVMKKNGLMAVPVDQQHQCLGVTNGNVEINDNVGDNTMVKTKKKRRRRHKPRKSPMDAPTDLNPVCDTKQNLPAPPAMIRRPVKLLPAEKGHVHFDSDKSEDEARLVSDAFSTDSHGIVDNKKAVAAMDVQHADTESSQMLAPSTCAPQRSDSQRNGAVSVREGGQHSNGDGNVKVFYRQKQSSEALTATTQKLESLPNVAVKEKDYSVYDLLHGPPRPGDRIAYKLLELSETYNPEVSSYKEAQVISYDPTTQTLDVKLDTAVVERKPGKFDLMLDDDNETNTEENIFQVSLSWPSLIEPRLLT